MIRFNFLLLFTVLLSINACKRNTPDTGKLTNTDDTVDSTTQKIQLKKSETEKSKSEEPTPQKREKINYAKVLSAKHFVYNGKNLSGTITFDYDDDSGGKFGALIFHIGGLCNYVYQYTLKDNEIEAKFYKSDCGASSPNRVFTINKDNTISTSVNGGKLVFKPEKSTENKTTSSSSATKKEVYVNRRAVSLSEEQLDQALYGRKSNPCAYGVECTACNASGYVNDIEFKMARNIRNAIMNCSVCGGHGWLCQ